jgi:hypothetical protein
MPTTTMRTATPSFLSLVTTHPIITDSSQAQEIQHGVQLTKPINYVYFLMDKKKQNSAHLLLQQELTGVRTNDSR